MALPPYMKVLGRMSPPGSLNTPRYTKSLGRTSPAQGLSRAMVCSLEANEAEAIIKSAVNNKNDTDRITATPIGDTFLCSMATPRSIF
jgi:hypothetical protein